MSMRLLAADLSLGRPFTSAPTSLLADNCLRRPPELMNMSNGDCLVRDDHQQLSMSSCNDQPPSDLHALEVYHKALEDERLKIQAFERELPFCMQLLDDAIEASKEQLEERLTCKLNTPLHDSPAHHQFVCNYTSSLMRGNATLTPTVGEINLHFKRSWSCTSPGPSSATPIDMAPSFDPTTRSLHQKTTMSTSIKDSPRSTLVEGCIKLQDVSLGDPTVPDAVDQNIHKTSLMFSSSTKSMDNIHPSHQLHTTSAMHLSSKPCRANGEQKGSDNMEAGCMQLDYKVDDIIKDHDDKRRCIQANPATLSINAPARLISANLSSPNSMYPRSISITKLAREEIHINTSLTSNSLAKATPLSSTSNTNTLQPGGVQRKPRRCWSPELHQRFLSALNHLGGCQVATPKQIRELMNVEGLTNDEVKSHLQKFRLHMRRPNAVNANSVQSTPPQTTGHHLVVFGHIWVPPEYANGEEHHHGAGATASCRSIMQNIPKSFPDTECRSEEMEHERSNVVKSLMSHDTLFRSTHNYACSFYSHDDQEASISRRNNNDIGQLADRQSPPHEAVHHSHNHPELEQLKSATSHAILHVATKGSDQQADTETAENGDAFADNETDISNMPRPARTQHAHCYPARFGSNLDDHGNLAQRMQVNVRAELSTSRDDVNLDGADKAGAGAKLGMEDGNDKPLLHLLKARDDNTSELLNGNSSKVSEHEALQLQADDERANINLTVGHHVNADPEYALHAADLGISADGAECTYQL